MEVARGARKTENINFGINTRQRRASDGRTKECEEWTHVIFNVNSGFLDLLGQLTVTDIDCDDDGIRLWVKTDDYNWFAPSESEGE